MVVALCALYHAYDYDYEYDYIYDGLRPIFIILTAHRSGYDNLSLSSRRGVWEVLCSQISLDYTGRPLTTPIGYTGGVLILLQLDIALRGEDHIPRVTYFYIYIYTYLFIQLCDRPYIQI